MRSIAILLSAVLFFILGTVVSTRAQSPGASPPPGVPAENWVPISETAGVLLSSDAPANAVNRFGGALGSVAERRKGMLLVQHDGGWIAFETLGDTSPQVFQLH